MWQLSALFEQQSQSAATAAKRVVVTALVGDSLLLRLLLLFSDLPSPASCCFLRFLRHCISSSAVDLDCFSYRGFRSLSQNKKKRRRKEAVERKDRFLLEAPSGVALFSSSSSLQPGKINSWDKSDKNLRGADWVVSRPKK